MLQLLQPILSEAEALAAAGAGAAALQKIQALPLDDFGHFLLGVPESLPAMRALLPRMADPQVQTNWTGSSGETLLQQSIAFVRTIVAAYAENGATPMSASRVLDFGCGWGRLMRLMLKYCAPERLFGVDPWDESIAICRNDGVLGQLAQSDYVPHRLPFDGVTFDFIYAFSVFTHLSEKTAERCLRTLRERISPRGLLIVTIRPLEWWHVHTGWDKQYSASQLIDAHNRHGFAFFPHNRAPIDGDVTYGDTSISLDYIKARWTDWEVVGIDHNRGDYYQMLVLLRPR